MVSLKVCSSFVFARARTPLPRLITMISAQNLLTMIALHDVNGNLTYIVGGQSDLTDAMTSPTGVISPLQTGEDVFNTDVNELSEPVLMEAREAASTRDTSLAIEFPAVPGTSTPAEKEEVGSQHPMLDKVRENPFHRPSHGALD